MSCNAQPLQPVLFPLPLCCSDSCKFLHDRSDYKHGWQIERELDEGRYGVNGTAALHSHRPELGGSCCTKASGPAARGSAAALSQPLARCEGESTAVWSWGHGDMCPQMATRWDGLCRSIAVAQGS